MITKWRLALSLLLAFGGTFEAKLEDHFKPCLSKSDLHKIRNIDFIYMINLDARPEKFESSLKQLLSYGITPYRFSAVNGWDLPLEVINDVALTYEPGMRTRNYGKKKLFGTSYLPENEGEPAHEPIHVPGKKYLCHCMSRGAVGIVLSHLSILQDAYDAGYQTIWVMEDDIRLIRNPHELSDLIPHLDLLVGKENWDILFTDQDTKNQQGEYVPCKGHAIRPNFTPKNPRRFAERKIIGPFIQTGARFGAYSMIVRRSGMKKVLDFLKTYHIFFPYDMEMVLPHEIKLYTVKDDIVSTDPRAISDNGGPNYLKKY